MAANWAFKTFGECVHDWRKLVRAKATERVGDVGNFNTHGFALFAEGTNFLWAAVGDLHQVDSNAIAKRVQCCNGGRECVDFAAIKGARLETFSGLAGIGDLTATVLAPGSRNRRAGEMLGSGVPAEQIPDRLGQASEGLDSVPLIAAAIERSGVDAEGLTSLAALIDGQMTAVEWVAGLRRVERARSAA